MAFLASYCFVFLAVAVLLAITGIGLQLRNMGQMSKMLDSMLDGKSNFFMKFLPVASCMLLAGVSFLLFIIGVVASFIN